MEDGKRGDNVGLRNSQLAEAFINVHQLIPVTRGRLTKSLFKKEEVLLHELGLQKLLKS